ncbi:hypothetical protein Droror1_Dr00002771 [Drosera rotundifolia]
MTITMLKSCFAMILVLALFTKGCLSQCDASNIQYGGERTGREVGGKPEWSTYYYLNCKCHMGHITITNCKDFQTTEPVDPAIFYKAGDTCLLKQGQFLPPHANVTFNYAWDQPFIFLRPSHAEVRCP